MYGQAVQPVLKRSYRTIISYMIFPYLSSAPPETQTRSAGIHQASGSVPDPWAVLPLRGSHRAVRRRKSHCAVTDLRHTSEAVRCLQAGIRSDLSIVLALSAAVAPRHRIVPDDCICSFQSSFSFQIRNGLRSLHIYFRKKMDVCRGPGRFENGHKLCEIIDS